MRERKQPINFPLKTRLGTLLGIITDGTSVRVLTGGTDELVDRTIRCNRVNCTVDIPFEYGPAAYTSQGWHVRWARDHRLNPVVGTINWRDAVVRNHNKRDTEYQVGQDQSVSFTTRDVVIQAISDGLAAHFKEHPEMLDRAAAIAAWNELADAEIALTRAAETLSKLSDVVTEKRQALHVILIEKGVKLDG